MLLIGMTTGGALLLAGICGEWVTAGIKGGDGYRRRHMHACCRGGKFCVQDRLPCSDMPCTTRKRHHLQKLIETAELSELPQPVETPCSVQNRLNAMSAETYAASCFACNCCTDMPADFLRICNLAKWRRPPEQSFCLNRHVLSESVTTFFDAVKCWSCHNLLNL